MGKELRNYLNAALAQDGYKPKKEFKTVPLNIVCLQIETDFVRKGEGWLHTETGYFKRINGQYHERSPSEFKLSVSA